MPRTLLKWYGGKSYLAPRIIEHFPEDYESMTYVEPFGGGAAVLCAKNPSHIEVYNDLNGDLVNFFNVLRSDPRGLQVALSLTPYSEEEFVMAGTGRGRSKLEMARQFFVGIAQSFGGSGRSWSYSVGQSRRGMSQVVSGWLTSIDERLPQVVERLRSVQVMNRRASEVIEKFDGPNALFYFDPPYLPESRVNRQVYAHEMTEEDHVALLSQLLSIRGKAVLSGYRSPLYDRYLSGWRAIDFDCALQSSCEDTRPRRTETIWLNW